MWERRWLPVPCRYHYPKKYLHYWSRIFEDVKKWVIFWKNWKLWRMLLSGTTFNFKTKPIIQFFTLVMDFGTIKEMAKRCYSKMVNTFVIKIFIWIVPITIHFHAQNRGIMKGSRNERELTKDPDEFFLRDAHSCWILAKLAGKAENGLILQMIFEPELYSYFESRKRSRLLNTCYFSSIAWGLRKFLIEMTVTGNWLGEYLLTNVVIQHSSRYYASAAGRSNQYQEHNCKSRNQGKGMALEKLLHIRVAPKCIG